MVTKQTIVINIDGKADKAINATKKTGDAVSRLGNTLKNLAIAGGVLFAAKKGFELLGASVRNLTGFIKESIDLAGVQEKAVKKLDTAIKTAGIHTEGASERLQEYASSLQKVTTYGDETIIEVEAMLATFGASEDVIQDATMATLDMAEAMDMDLKAAAILLGKAIAGETGTLSRYGIIIDHDKYATEGFSVVLDALNSKFGGQAQAAAETYEGRLEQLKNVFGDMKEDVGNALIPTITNLIEWFMTGKEVIDPLTGSVSNLASPFEKLQGHIKNATENMGEWIDLNWPNIISIAKETFQKISEFITIVQEADYSKIKQGIGDLTFAFNALTSEEGGIKDADQQYQDFIDKVGESISTMASAALLISGIWETLKLIIGTVTNIIVVSIQTLQEFIPVIGAPAKETESVLEGIKNKWIALKDTAVEQAVITGDTWDKYMELLERSVTESTSSAAEEFEELEQGIFNNFKEMGKAAQGFQKELDALHGKTIYSEHITHNKTITSMYNAPPKPGTSRASGGVLGMDEYIPDLGLFGKKGEAWIPASLVKAIKENRSSFAGLDADNSRTSVVNEIHVHIENRDYSPQTIARLVAEEIVGELA